MVERANCVIALRFEGVSLVLDISNGQLPAILRWGADLGTLELADIEALILSHIDHARPRCHRRPPLPTCIPIMRSFIARRRSTDSGR